MGRSILWLGVTRDEYELPIYIEESAEKLGERVGKSASTIRQMAMRGTNPSKSGAPFFVVKVNMREVVSNEMGGYDTKTKSRSNI